MIFESVFIIWIYLWSSMFQSPQFDVLIKNGRIVDGSGRAAYVADIGIKDDRIVSIGKLSNASASRTIDAQGLVVAPGTQDRVGPLQHALIRLIVILDDVDGVEILWVNAMPAQHLRREVALQRRKAQTAIAIVLQ